MEDQLPTEKSLSDALDGGAVDLFGLVNCGKSTHGKRLAARLNGAYVEGGEILRNPDIDMSAETRAIMDSGELIPPDEFTRLTFPFLKPEGFDGRPLILGSFGRFDGEQYSVRAALMEAGHPLRVAVYLVLSEQKALERLMNRSHGRADDDVTKFPTRVKAFEEKTMPVIEYYRQKKMLVEVDADAPKPVVDQRIFEALLSHTFSSR